MRPASDVEILAGVILILVLICGLIGVEPVLNTLGV